MTPPPTNIDGTDITGATIDGQDVQEITVDGQVVFSAGPGLNDLVANNDLVAWYPFENSGNDETRTGGVLDNAGVSVGDSTDYSLSVNGPTFLPSGGVTDLDVGANSGAFDFDGVDDSMEFSGSPFVSPSSGFTVTFWVNFANLSSNNVFFQFFWEFTSNNDGFYLRRNPLDLFVGDVNQDVGSLGTDYVHIAVRSNNGYDVFVDGVLEHTQQGDTNLTSDFYIGGEDGVKSFAEVELDDVRVYDTPLSSTQINTIISQTQP